MKQGRMLLDDVHADLAHGLDDEAVIMGKEEDAARFARRRQLSQGLVTCKPFQFLERSLQTRAPYVVNVALFCKADHHPCA